MTHPSRRIAIPPLHDEERNINPNLIGVDTPYNYTDTNYILDIFTLEVKDHKKNSPLELLMK